MKLRRLFASLLLSNALFNPFTPIISYTIPTAVFAAEEEMTILDEKPEVTEIPVKNEPNRIFTTLQEDPTSTMGFAWYTTEQFEDAKVIISTKEDLSDPIEFKAQIEEVESHYLEKTKDGNIIFSFIETDEEGNEKISGYATDEGMEDNKAYMAGKLHGKVEMVPVTEYSYHAKAENLEPGTTYYYQLGSEKGGMSKVGQFKTAAKEQDSFKFIHIGDTQVAFWNENVYNESAYAADTFEQALKIAGDNVDFIVHGGDVVERGEIEDEWLDLTDQMEESLLSVPIVVAPGNHEDMTANRDGQDLPYLFNQHINQPITNEAVNSGSYFSFDYHNMHFILVNTEDNRLSADNFNETAIGMKQMEWLREDLEKSQQNPKDWTIVAQHKPIFSKSYWSFDQDIRRNRFDLQALFDEFNVDLVLQAHSHVLSRTLPLVQDLTSDHFTKTVVAEYTTEEKDGVEHYISPQGTIYTLPNGAGTKSYEITHTDKKEQIIEEHPDFNWMNDKQIDQFNSFFADIDIENFKKFESVDHDCSLQHFTIYEVNGKEMTATTYEISGDLHKGEERKVKIVDQFGITKK